MSNLASHMLKSAYSFFIEDDEDHLTSRIRMQARPVIEVIPVSEIEMKTETKPSMMERVGEGAVKAGVAILSVPDPLPVADEMVGIGLVVGGAAMLYASGW